MQTPTGAGNERDEDMGGILDALLALAHEARLEGHGRTRRARLGPAQLHALRLLADRPGASLSDLADRAHTDVSSASVVVTRLLEHGLVTRTTDADDRRRMSLRLTARGRAAVRRTPEAAAARIQRVASHLGDREVHALASGLVKLADRLRRLPNGDAAVAADTRQG